jgi:sulfite exporter TauE/SafE
MLEAIYTGLIFGLVTSLHCAGMCGPIAVALPLHGETVSQKLFGGFLYNIGRTVTYVGLGAVLGLFGQGINALGFQSWLSVVTGVLMISTVAFPSLFSFNMGGSGSQGWSLLGRLKAGLRRLFSTRSYTSLFGIGLLNGFLPCGPLYAALIISAGYGQMTKSMLFMAMFGLGTIPMLLTISAIGNILSLSVRKKFSKLLPALIVVIGLLFILRGLNLGIPFLSPKKEKIEKKMEKTRQEMQSREAGLKDIQMELDAGKQAHCCGS